MSDHFYKIVEVVGSSTTTIEAAVENALRGVANTVRNIGWFHIVETRGHVENGNVSHYQVTLKVGFTVDDP